MENNNNDWVDLPNSEVDDWADLEAPSQLESGLRGAAQGLTFGFADEISGGVQALFSDSPFMDAYRKHRDESREEFKAAQEANPKSYFAGELVGGMAVPLPGAAALKTGSTLAKVGKGAAMGAGFGAASAAGSTEESLTSKEGLKDVATGATVGGVIGGAIPAAGKAASKFLGLGDSTAMRMDALHTTSTQKAKELVNPPLAKTKEAALEYGKKVGLFKGTLSKKKFI